MYSTDNSLVAIQSMFGYVIYGQYQTQDNYNKNQCLISNVDLNSMLTKFWNIESFGILPSDSDKELTVDEQHAVDHFKANIDYLDNLYKVHLCFKSSMPKLLDNYNMALKRLENIERKLKDNKDLATGTFLF